LVIRPLRLLQFPAILTWLDDALEIAANVEGAALPIILKADQGDDAGDEWKINVADGGTITFGNDANSAGTYVTHLTITPNSTVTSSTVAFAGNLTVATALSPDASGGADLGSASAEWGDAYIADDKYINFGSDQNILVGYDETTTDSLKIAATEGAGLAITLMADQGDDAGDEWKLNVADGGTITLGNDIASAGTYVTHLTITPNSTVANSTVAFAGGVTIASDLTITGDDLTMTTNTSGAALIGDGTNFNPVLISGDISIGTTGTAAIGSGVIVNADVNSSAAIADSKLATISTAGKVDIGALEIDGATDIGAGLADADLIIVDDNASGTEKKCAMSRVITYVNANATIPADTALILALG